MRIRTQLVVPKLSNNFFNRKFPENKYETESAKRTVPIIKATRLYLVRLFKNIMPNLILKYENIKVAKMSKNNLPSDILYLHSRF